MRFQGKTGLDKREEKTEKKKPSYFNPWWSVKERIASPNDCVYCKYYLYQSKVPFFLLMKVWGWFCSEHPQLCCGRSSDLLRGVIHLSRFLCRSWHPWTLGSLLIDARTTTHAACRTASSSSSFCSAFHRSCDITGSERRLTNVCQMEARKNVAIPGFVHHNTYLKNSNLLSVTL